MKSRIAIRLLCFGGMSSGGYFAAESFSPSQSAASHFPKSRYSFLKTTSRLPAKASTSGGTGGTGSPSSQQQQSSASSVWGGARSAHSNFAVPSKTARESAVNVEWEPMTELERRIEDGVHYEHLPSHWDVPQQSHRQRQRLDNLGTGKRSRYDTKEDGHEPSVRAVFCGYRYSEEEYNRLKAAEIVE